MKKRNIFSRQAVNFLWVLLGLGAGLQFIEVIWAASKGYLGFFSMMVVIVTEMVITGSIYVIIYKFLIKPCNETRKLFKHFIQSGSFQELIDQDYQIFPEQNEVMQKLDSILDKKNIIELSTKHAELLALQNQINPHFLYNTLDTIMWLAEAKQTEDVVSMVTWLSDFFRTTLSKGQDYITVEEEKNHIDSYLKIQHFRYQDILEYEIDIEEEIYDYMIPKLTLQPLVENALYHGIKLKRGMGKILIQGFQKGERLIFRVIDNGKGMDEKTLNELRKRIAGLGSASDGGFGLSNVNQRLQYYFGEEYGVFLESEENVGTEATIITGAKKNITLS